MFVVIQNKCKVKNIIMSLHVLPSRFIIPTYIIIFIFIGIRMYSQNVSIQQADKYTQYYMTIYYCVV